MDIQEFLPLPTLLNSTPDPVREFIYSALQIKALQKLYFDARCCSGEALSQRVLNTLQITVNVSVSDLAHIPATGPVIIVANHPFGLLDGMVLDSILLGIRSDVRILTNAVLCQLEELRQRFIPVNVFSDKTDPNNVRAIRLLMNLLRHGHGVAIFPAGEVSHWNAKQWRITDGRWNQLAVRCAKQMNAKIVPVFFSGSNSLLFQFAGLLHRNLRTACLPSELLNKQGYKVEVRIGTPIAPAELPTEHERATAYIRARTYMLNYRSLDQDVRSPSLRQEESVLPAVPLPIESLSSEINRLGQKGCSIIESDAYIVYAERGDQIPQLLEEIGRLRELTFRNVGEGTGTAFDLDQHDRYYTHLILWHKTQSRVAGSYRLVWTHDVLPSKGVKGLYTSALFRYSPEFFAKLGPAVELGRSFICPDYQKDYAPLLLLWQAIARCITQRPEAHTLFGAVSISASYPAASRELMVKFLLDRCFRKDLAHFVAPRQPFRSRLLQPEEITSIVESLGTIDDLPIGDLSSRTGVPVLLRQYLRLGGKVAAFNVDPKFSDSLDGLLILNLCHTAPKLLAKYMGEEQSAAFLEHVRLAASA